MEFKIGFYKRFLILFKKVLCLNAVYDALLWGSGGAGKPSINTSNKLLKEEGNLKPKNYSHKLLRIQKCSINVLYCNLSSAVPTQAMLQESISFKQGCQR